MLINLIVMLVQWTVVSFCYYQICFQVKYLKGDIFINNISGGITEAFSYAAGGVLLSFLGLKKGLISGYMLGTIGMFSLLIYQGDSQIWLSIFICSSKFGITSSFGICYFANNEIFPAQAVVFCLGTCAAIGHIASIFSPEVAELKPESIAKWAFIITNAFAAVCVIFLRLGKNNSKK